MSVVVKVEPGLRADVSTENPEQVTPDGEATRKRELILDGEIEPDK